MQRWQAAFFGALLVLAAYVIIRESSGRRPGDVAIPSATGAPIGPAPAPPSPAARPLSLDLDAGLPFDEPVGSNHQGDVLPNGSSAPRLTEGAPKTVNFGAILVEYKGAQAASHGARSREEAISEAKRLAELAKTDFAGAVREGDKGSAEELGAMPRGILEPGPEFVLFNLRVGEISDPVDSPRGFYVFKRTE